MVRPHVARRRARAPGGDHRAVVWLLIASVWVASGLLLFWVRDLPSPAFGGSELRAWWPFVSLGFFLAEGYAVHVEYRGQTLTLTLSEVPLVLGLFFVPPLTLLAAQLLGSLLALTLRRHQPFRKALFNLGQFALREQLALLTFYALLVPPHAIGQRTWAAALAAVLVETAVGSLLVGTVILVTDPKASPAQLVRANLLDLAGTIAVATMSLTGVLILVLRPDSIWLLFSTWAAIALAYRQLVASREQQQSLAFLYEASRQLGNGARLDAVVTSLLEEVRSRFRADLAELVLLSGHDGREGFRVTVGPGDAQDAGPVPPELRDLDLAGDCTVVGEGDTGPLAEALRARGIRNAMLVRLTADDTPLGVLLVANRLGDVVRGFGEGDRTLFVTLASQIRGALDNGRLERNVSDLRQLKDELRHQAFHDGLTGLANRTLFTTRVEDALSEAAGGTTYVGVLFVDLDDFKTVNDTMGHAAGDELLRHVAELVLPCLRAGDTAARLGGDEFAICLPGLADVGEASAIATRILDALAVPIRVEGRMVWVRASIGVALDESRSWDAADLLRCADVAMYMAKVQGKSRYEVFDAGMHEQVSARRELKVDLQRAVDREEFVVVYQPIVDVASGAITGAEALVRWEHPDRGTVYPDEFIGLAEEMGLIGLIGKQVLRTACDQLAAWQVGMPWLSMNVNVSVRQLGQHSFVEDVASVLAETGVAGRSVVLEITESAMVGDARGWRETLRGLKELGVRLAVDDFGTGYSALSYLNDLPIDVLKVAKPFVDGLDDGPKDAALGQAIIGMGLSLGLEIVAEGVERQAQLDELRRLRCPSAQGWLFGRPMTAEALTGRLASERGGVASGPAEPAAGYAPVIPMMRPSSDQRSEQTR